MERDDRVLLMVCSFLCCWRRTFSYFKDWWCWQRLLQMDDDEAWLWNEELERIGADIVEYVNVVVVRLTLLNDGIWDFLLILNMMSDYKRQRDKNDNGCDDTIKRIPIQRDDWINH